jgi:putative spermidine/putrescine transport system substrate-binding protein
MNSNWMNRLSLGITSLSVLGAANLFGAASASAEPSAQLVAAAKAEGHLTLMALPRDWCNYGELIDGFKAKYGIAISDLNPDAGSGDEVEAIRANKGNNGPQAPDVIDVGLSFAPKAKAEGLLAQGFHLEHHSGSDQGRGGVLVRRLLRCAVLRSKH